MEEIWRDVVGYEGLFQVSNLGRVKSLERRVYNHNCFALKRERVLAQHKDGSGYFRVSLCVYKTKKV